MANVSSKSDTGTKAKAQKERQEAEARSLRETVRSLLESGKAEQAVDVLLSTIESLQKDNDRLAYRLAAAIRARFGRRSERLNAEELGQLVLAFGGTQEQAATADPIVPTPEGAPENSEGNSPADKQKKKRPNHKGRGKLSPDLERIINFVPVPEDERKCIHCKAEMQGIGHIDTETIEFVPAKIFVKVERREKLACVSCKQDIVSAPRISSEPNQPRAGVSLFAYLIESKCDDALPVYRQRDQLRRLGFDVPLNSLYGYWDRATSLLVPLADVIVSTVLDDFAVGVDDTKLDFLDRDDPRGKRRGHLWCFVGNSTLVGFVFTETWQAEDIEPWISAIDGFIQCDAYKGYSATITGEDGSSKILVPHERRLGCAMHVRRPFHEAYVGGHTEAALPLKLLADIYKIEEHAKRLGVDASERLLLRQQQSLPLLGQFDAWVDERLPKLLPKSPLGSAARYAKEQRVFLRRCFTDGRFEIDNGRVEREIREPAVGRKNFLFSGSAAGAARLAAAYTVVQSARRTGLPVREYLIDVLDRLSRGWPVRRFTELLPTRWAEARGIRPAK